MNINPGKTEFTEGEHVELVLQVRAVITTEGVSQAEVSRQAEIPSASLSQYLNGRYPNETGKADIAARLTRWLQAREAARQLRRRVPLKPPYLKLRGSEAIVDALAYARATGRMVLITGMPGVCKTAAALQYAADTPRTWYAAMDTTTSGVPSMLLEILGAMGVSDARGTPQILIRQICEHAVVANGLIIIDEAQHLSPKAIEALRSINDRTRRLNGAVGVAVLGNEEAYSAVGPTGGRAAFAQVSSRFAHREFIGKPQTEDAAALAKAFAEVNDEVITPKEIAFCEEIATRPGGLRNIEMTFEKALIAARGAEEAFGVDHLRAAFATLSGAARGR